MKYILRSVYLLSSIFKVKNRIILGTYRKDSLEGNYEYIIRELEKNKYPYEVLYKKQEKGIKNKIKYFLHMIKVEYYMATSKYFIIDDFYLPVYMVSKLRKGTEIIQVWHACGAFKKFGFSIVEKGFGASKEYVKDIPIHSNYSKVVVTSKEVSKHYAEAFNMEEGNIKPIGVPRTDIFFDEREKEKIKGKLYKRYPKIKNKKIILYAPTFRGENQGEAQSPIGFNINKLVDNLKEEYILVIKLHPLVKKGLKIKNKKIVDMSDYNIINDILCITDILITDYSSTIFEFALLERKIILYADDLDEYIKERDFYYEYESFVPGPIAKNTEELISCINTDDYNYDRVKRFKDKFFDYRDGKSTERLVKELIKL